MNSLFQISSSTNTLLLFAVINLLLLSCKNPNAIQESPVIKAQNKSDIMSCTLSSPELLERKSTVLASLKEKVLLKKELHNGFAYKFEGSDLVLNELTEFIKSERECCSFFVFNISISGDKSEAWLELTGPEGTKDVIVNELGM